MPLVSIIVLVADSCLLAEMSFALDANMLVVLVGREGFCLCSFQKHGIVDCRVYVRKPSSGGMRNAKLSGESKK